MLDLNGILNTFRCKCLTPLHFKRLKKLCSLYVCTTRPLEHWNGTSCCVQWKLKINVCNRRTREICVTSYALHSVQTRIIVSFISWCQQKYKRRGKERRLFNKEEWKNAATCNARPRYDINIVPAQSRHDHTITSATEADDDETNTSQDSRCFDSVSVEHVVHRGQRCEWILFRVWCERHQVITRHYETLLNINVKVLVAHMTLFKSIGEHWKHFTATWHQCLLLSRIISTCTVGLDLSSWDSNGEG